MLDYGPFGPIVLSCRPGCSAAHKVNPDPEGVIEYYDEMPLDPLGYEGQDVLILGRGSAGPPRHAASPRLRLYGESI